jgi:hypothetical protein
MLTKPIAFLGGGQMAEALIGGLLAAGACEPASICATDPVAARRDVLKSRFGIRVGDENAKAVREADLVVLAVKPQAMSAVLSDAGAGLCRKIDRVHCRRCDDRLDSRADRDAQRNRPGDAQHAGFGAGRSHGIDLSVRPPI